jgi:hypothetical protein
MTYILTTKSELVFKFEIINLPFMKHLRNSIDTKEEDVGFEFLYMRWDLHRPPLKRSQIAATSDSPLEVLSIPLRKTRFKLEGAQFGVRVPLLDNRLSDVSTEWNLNEGCDM